MELTNDQLKTIMVDYLKKGKTLREWMNDNQLGPADIRPRQILEQLKTVYKEETVMEAMKGLRDARFGQQFSVMAARMCSRPNVTVEQCDMMLAKLQDAIVTVNAKKAELQAG